MSTDFQKGNLLLAAGDYKEAIECFLRHAETNPQERAKAYVQVAKCFRQTNILTEPKPVGPGVTLIKKGDWVSAERYYRLALLSEPNHFQALRGLAEILPAGSDERLQILEQAAARQPNYMVLICLGDFYRTHRKDFSRAYDIYRRAQEQNPRDKDAYLRLNDICRRLGRAEEAKEWSERWKQVNTMRKRVDGK
jgi:tetratricopeptide (TPR) repeat protein